MKNRKVLIIAKTMEIIGINNIGLCLNKIIHGKKYIRAINYHSTPKHTINQFEKQMEYYSKHYTPVSKQDLERLLKGEWNKDKPGLIISFDDGLESNYKYARPILEKYNFVGWFFVPTGLIGKGYCKNEHRTGETFEKYMDWEQVRDLHKNHIIGCHTLTHQRLKNELNENVLKEQILYSKELLEQKLNKEVDVFCWVGGGKESYSEKASNIIKDSNYRYAFLTNHYPIKPGNNPLQLERTNIEADWPIYLIKFYTSFFMDIRYHRKRTEVRKILG